MQCVALEDVMFFIALAEAHSNNDSGSPHRGAPPDINEDCLCRAALLGHDYTFAHQGVSGGRIRQPDAGYGHVVLRTTGKIALSQPARLTPPGGKHL